jgi:outer membrane protein TolC
MRVYAISQIITEFIIIFHQSIIELILFKVISTLSTKKQSSGPANSSNHFVVILCLIVLITIVNNPLFAQNELQYYIERAFSNNPNLKENSNLIRISELDKSLVESQNSLPQISLTSNYLFTPYFNNSGNLITTNPDSRAIGYDTGITNGGLYSAQINIQKNIFNGGIIDVLKNQSELKIKSNENASELVKHNIIKEVTEQYLNTYQYQQLYRLSIEITDTMKNQLELSESLLNKGLIKQSDFLFLKIELDNQNISAANNFNNFRKNLSDLNTICGLKDTASVNLSYTNLDYSKDTKGNNFIKQYRIDSLQISNQQEVLETKYKPQVNLFFNTGLNAVELNDIQRKFGLSAGINFSLPVYDGNQNSLTRQQTQISLNTVSAYKENQTISIKNKIKASGEEIVLSWKNLESLTNQINNFSRLLIFAKAELMHGQRTMTDFITLIKSYIELKETKVETECDYQKSINQYNYWNW